ncbi:MAG: tol-pal system-associated acyl-CoA thioesterase [Alphaproteobacteria bacterium]|nr:tol-pal system-associated acyl-CoA thioesterase [Alphaproteobacteria bacterium]
MTDTPATHIFPIRVYYEDTDSEGIVYYANYLKFAERGRTEMLRAAGIEHSTLWDEYGVGFAVRNMSADYLRPAKLDDSLTIHSRLLAIRGASMSAEQVVRRDEEDLVRITVRLACIDRSSKPARFPQPLRVALGAYKHDI